MTITDIMSLVALITGTVGCVLSTLNFLYDRAKVVVSFQWDMKPWGNIPLDENKLYGCISVTNVGRRPVFISHASLKFPGHNKYGVLYEGLKGETLKEGDPPKRYPVSQEGLEEYSKDWSKIRGCVEDSTGKRYYSKPVLKQPSWAKTES